MLSVKEVSHDETRLEIEKCLCLENYLAYEDDFNRVLSGQQRVVTLDLRMVSNLTPLTLERIMKFEEKLFAQGKTLRITGCCSGVASTLKLLKLDEYISIL